MSDLILGARNGIAHFLSFWGWILGLVVSALVLIALVPTFILFFLAYLVASPELKEQYNREAEPQ